MQAVTDVSVICIIYNVKLFRISSLCPVVMYETRTVAAVKICVTGV